MDIHYARTLLGVTEEDDLKCVTSAYRKKARLFHPDRIATSKLASTNAFQNINKAFELLKEDINKKSSCTGVHIPPPSDEPAAAAAGTGKKRKNRSSDHRSRKNNEYGDFVFQQGATFNTDPTRKAQKMSDDSMLRSEDTSIDLFCTLEDIYNGKDVTYSHPSGEVLRMRLPRGVSNNTKFLFEGKSIHNKEDLDPGDLVFTVKEVPHAEYVRDGLNLHYTVNMLLVRALAGELFSFTALDGRLLSFPITSVITPDTTKIIQGEGLTCSKTKTKGDLHLKFNICFPTTLTPEQKRNITAALNT